MTSKPNESPLDDEEVILKGTTLRIYRFIFRAGKSVGIHDVQRGLGLSSPSVAEYHIRKLLRANLIHPSGSGYIADRIIFENMVRLKRTLIPLQVALSAFFATTLAIMLTLLRPIEVTPTYLFGAAVNCVALAISVHGSVRALRNI